MLRDESPLAETLRVVAVECGTPNIKVLDVWHGRLPGGSVLFFSPAGLCGLGLSGPASPTAPLLAAGKPSEEIEAFVCDGDGHDLAPLFAGDLFLRFPGWKKVAGGTSRRGLATGLLAWREENGCLHVESAAAKAPGVVTVEASRRLLKVLPDALDACSDEQLLWTLAGGGGALRVEEWPLNRGGWIDVSALPRPEVAKAPKVPSETVKVQAPRVAVVAAAAAWTPVVVLQEAGPGSRLVLIHGASGDVDLYLPLAEAIGATRRVIAIRSRGAADPEACHPSIESAAAAYLGAVFEDDPSGRFVLAGYGYGAAVALEMARQLKAAGRKVPKLLLIGAPAPAAESKGGWASLVKSAMSRFSASQPIEPGDLSSGASSVHDAAWRRYRFVSSDIAADVVLPSDFPPEAIDAWQDLLPDAAIEPVTCVWSEMLTFPSVKRLASLLDERH
jgi:pimeloyl-ACP methyl ester carboxylesterase